MTFDRRQRQPHDLWEQVRRVQAARPLDEDDTGPGHDGPAPPRYRRRVRRIPWPDPPDRPGGGRDG